VRLEECWDRGVECLLRKLGSSSFVQPWADVRLRRGRHCDRTLSTICLEYGGKPWDVRRKLKMVGRRCLAGC